MVFWLARLPLSPLVERESGKWGALCQAQLHGGPGIVDINMGNLHLRDWIVNTAGVRKSTELPVRAATLFNENEKACPAAFAARTLPAVGDPSG